MTLLLGHIVCPRSSCPFYIVGRLLYKKGHYFMDMQYIGISHALVKSILSNWNLGPITGDFQGSLGPIWNEKEHLRKQLAGYLY